MQRGISISALENIDPGGNRFRHSRDRDCLSESLATLSVTAITVCVLKFERLDGFLLKYPQSYQHCKKFFL